MLTWEQIVETYIGKNINQIKATTRPLHDHFGIDYFTYHKIDTNGNYTVLVDRPDWAEHYVENKLYLIDPYLRNMEVFKTGRDLIPTEQLEDVLQNDLGVILIEKSAQAVEFFGFTGKKQSSALQNLFCNHTQILKSFGKHFTQKMQPLLRKMEEEASSLADLKGEAFYSKESPPPCFLPYLEDLGIDCSLLNKLSPRERECLKHLKKTSKETSQLLNLSPRTVEFYLENIKNKLGCFTKQELLSKIAPFEEIL